MSHAASTSDAHTPVADALVLVMSAGGSLTGWERDGSLEREWALYHRLRHHYGAILVVSDAKPADADSERAIAARLGCALVMNDAGLDRAAYLASLGERVAGTLGAPRSVVVKTNQLSCADAALALTDNLRARSLRVALIARGGYLWSRFAASEHGPDSRLALECAAAERDLVRRADLVVGTTRSMLADLAWRDALPASKLTLIPNYVVPAPAAPAPREHGRILYAGQLSARKRVDLLIRAVALVASTGRQVMLDLVGAGPERDALVALARALNAPVTFHDREPHASVLARMRRCWVYAQASSLEGHPKTILEAMAAAAAVVATRASGIDDCDAIEHGNTALLTRPDEYALARAICRVLDDPWLAARLGTEAASRVASLYAVDAIVPLEIAAHRLAASRAASETAHAVTAAPPVRWDPALLNADRPAQVAAWERSLHGFAKRLEPRRRAEFLAELDTYVYSMQGEAAVAAGNGIHPKHDLIRYHDFFVERVRPGERVIDLGCGIGAVAASLATRAGAAVTGIDWSDQNLERARRLVSSVGAPNINLIRGDITRDRAPGEYDVVVLSNVLEHIADRPARLREWAAWYGRPRFLIRVPAFDREWRVPWKQALGVEWRLDLTHETEYTLEQLESELKEAGLAIESIATRWGEYYVQARAA